MAIDVDTLIASIVVAVPAAILLLPLWMLFWLISFRWRPLVADADAER